VPAVELPIAERGVTTGTPVQAVAPAGAAPVAEAAGGVLTDTPAIAAAPEAMGETAPDTRAEVAGAESAAPPAFDPPVHLTAEAGDTQAAEQAGSVESAAGAASEEGDAGDAETDDAHARAPQTAALASAAAAYQSASVAATGRAADLTAAGTRAAVAAPHPAQPAAPSDVQAATGGAPIAGRVVDQVANGLAMHVREGRTEATLTLRPEALGEVRVHIVAGPAGLTIRLSAEREAVTELLRASAGELHAALAGRQVPVSELHVLYNAPPAAPPRTEQAFWQERPWSRREQAQGDGDGSPPRKQSGENDEE
jgi:hypothetical protein